MTLLVRYAMRGVTIIAAIAAMAWLAFAAASASFSYMVVTAALVVTIMILSIFFRED